LNYCLERLLFSLKLELTEFRQIQLEPERKKEPRQLALYMKHQSSSYQIDPD